MFCLHHNDADGLCAGAIVKRRFGNKVELYEIDYGLPIPWDKINAASSVIITDFSLPRKDMLKIYQTKGDNFIWIDHHISAINALPELTDLPGIRHLEEAACILTWKYFFPKEDIPVAVHLIGDRDIWRFAYPQTQAFCEGLFFADTKATNDAFWSLLLNNNEDKIEQLIEEGEILLAARLKEIARRVKNHSFETNFAKCKTLAINLPSNGDIGNHICRLGYDLAYVYVDTYNEGQVVTKVTLYSKTVDVSKIAQQYGGGGHKGAAGFKFIRTDNNPFPK